MLMQRDRLILSFIEKYGGITISQCSKIFFKGKNAYTLARKRLAKIEMMNKDLKSYVNQFTNEKIYTFNKNLSQHNIYLYNFYASLVEHNCEIIEFTNEKRWLDGKFRSDGFFIIKDFNGNKRAMCVEVDITHGTNIGKYEEIATEGEFTRKYGGIPMIVIIGEQIIKYDGKLLDVRYLNYNFKDFLEIILSF